MRNWPSPMPRWDRPRAGWCSINSTGTAICAGSTTGSPRARLRRRRACCDGRAASASAARGRARGRRAGGVPAGAAVGAGRGAGGDLRAVSGHRALHRRHLEQLGNLRPRLSDPAARALAGLATPCHAGGRPLAALLAGTGAAAGLRRGLAAGGAGGRPGGAAIRLRRPLADRRAGGAGSAAGHRHRLRAAVPVARRALRRRLYRPADRFHGALHGLGAAAQRHTGAARGRQFNPSKRQLVSGGRVQRRALPDRLLHAGLPVCLPELPFAATAFVVPDRRGRRAHHRQRLARLHDRDDRSPERHDAGGRHRPYYLRLAVFRAGHVAGVCGRWPLARRTSRGRDRVPIQAGRHARWPGRRLRPGRAGGGTVRAERAGAAGARPARPGAGSGRAGRHTAGVAGRARLHGLASGLRDAGGALEPGTGRRHGPRRPQCAVLPPQRPGQGRRQLGKSSAPAQGPAVGGRRQHHRQRGGTRRDDTAGARNGAARPWRRYPGVAMVLGRWPLPRQRLRRQTAAGEKRPAAWQRRRRRPVRRDAAGRQSCRRTCRAATAAGRQPRSARTRAGAQAPPGRPPMNPAPLVVHLLYRLDVGGMETLLVDCIRRMPPERYRHAVVCLSDYSAFADQLRAPHVQLYALHKRPGLAPATHVALWKLLRRLRPALLHTYNLAAIEYHASARLAGVRAHLHAEHGRDSSDPHGRNRKHNLLRRLLTPLIDTYVPVSRDLQQWLAATIGVPARKNRLLPNGVDTAHYRPDGPVARHFDAGCIVIGTVGRLHAVKNHSGLIDAFVRLRALLPALAPRLRLAIVGDGHCADALRAQVRDAGLGDVVWLAGARDDIAALLRGFSVFALSSIAEGTPVSILEATAAGLPIVSTNVGGIAEVVDNGRTGLLAAAGDNGALAAALAYYCAHPRVATLHGQAGRAHVQQHASIDATVAAYLDVYETLTQTHHRGARPACVES